MPEQTSTELLQSLIDREAGKKTESFKTKLTDADVLKKFVLGIAAAASGEAGLGAALVGSGAHTAAKEAEADNKLRDQKVEDLSLKMVGLKEDREQNLFNQVVANPEFGAAAGETINRMANSGDVDLFEISQNIVNKAENRRIAVAMFEGAQNIRDPQEREAAIGKAINVAGWEDKDGYIRKALASDKFDSVAFVTAASESTPASVIAASKLLAENAPYPEIIAALVPYNKPINLSAADYDEARKRKALEVRTRAYTIFSDPANAGKFATINDVINNPQYISPEDNTDYYAGISGVDRGGDLSPYAGTYDEERYEKIYDALYGDLQKANQHNADMGVEKLMTQTEIAEIAQNLAYDQLTRERDMRYGLRAARTATVLDYVAQTLAAGASGTGDIDPATRMRAADIIQKVEARVASEHPDLVGTENYEQIVQREIAIEVGTMPPETSFLAIQKPAPKEVGSAAEQVEDYTAKDLGEGQALLPGMAEHQEARVAKVNAKKHRAERLAASQRSARENADKRKRRREAAREYLFNQGAWVANNITNDMAPEEVEKKIKERVKEVGLATVNPASALFFTPGSKLVDNFVDDKYEQALKKVIPGETLQETAELILEYLEGDLEKRVPK